MDGQIVRLNAADYDEALDFLNLVFSMGREPHDFQQMLPIMWARDDEHVGKHLAVKRDGKIRALLGIYPLPVVIGGKKLLFSTVGNVATHPYDEGKGYMSALLDEAMRELERIGADASRLGGKRQRYNRYGYEPAGALYNFSLTRHNVLRAPHDSQGIVFRPIEATDAQTLACARAWFEAGGIAVERKGDDGFFKSLRAWRNIPYAAFDGEGTMIGYLTANAAGTNVSEQYAVSPERLADMLCAWLSFKDVETVSFSIAPWQPACARVCQCLCEDWRVTIPSHFFIRHWAEVIEALLALKASYTALPEGRAVVHIEGYGAIELCVGADGVRCTRTNATPCLSLAPLSATRFFMGPLPALCVAEAPKREAALLNAWLPLPLSWDTLDRV